MKKFITLRMTRNATTSACTSRHTTRTYSAAEDSFLTSARYNIRSDHTGQVFVYHVTFRDLH